MSVKADQAVVALREALSERLDALADEATEIIFAEVPAYGSSGAPLRDDVRAHVLAHLRASVDSFGTGREITREDLLFVRQHATRRTRRVSLADFVHAFYVGERVLWDTALALAEDAESRQAALELASHMPRYFEVATTHAAEVYLEASEELAATGERIRRDLLEELLAGRDVGPGPRLDAARAAGLRDGASCLVISAAPVEALDDEQLLRSAAAAIARAAGAGAQPLAVVRREEIVVAVQAGRAPTMIEQALGDLQQRLADGGLVLAIGVSTPVPSTHQIAEAYREATSARESLGSGPGVVALPAMSAFDYLTMRADATASRMISPAIHRFVAQDTADGGALIGTLREYVACDLNVRQAADNLHVHVNTAHYRLGRIGERTGCDLRRVSDLIEILIASRLADTPDGA